jgi:hypothetical protein
MGRSGAETLNILNSSNGFWAVQFSLFGGTMEFLWGGEEDFIFKPDSSTTE